MSQIQPPNPILDGPHQPGITDPQWPIQPPIPLNDEDQQRYAFERAGRIDPQSFLTVVTANLRVGTRPELQDVLNGLSSFARAHMLRRPDNNHIPVLRSMPDTWRVTVTIGLGASVFMSADGDDRFGLRHAKPRWLRRIPRVAGDDFDPEDHATDLIFLISSDHPYVNVSIARALCQGNWGAAGLKETRIVVTSINEGFARPDRREFLRFDDGIDNLSNARNGELDRFVYIHSEDGEPDSAIGGTYLAYRKIRENLPRWEAQPESEQEKMVGRRKATGEPLSRRGTGVNGMTPVYPDPKDARDGPLESHIRKVQPRRNDSDFLGVHDLDRRFLRRGYPFFDNLDAQGQVQSGLLFLAFARNLRKQFEWPVLNWQTNPDFPVPGTGIDALYESRVLTNIAGGYYFCPRAPLENEYVGLDMFR
jgi:deferrochelatase/peroxidase EfeB